MELGFSSQSKRKRDKVSSSKVPFQNPPDFDPSPSFLTLFSSSKKKWDSPGFGPGPASPVWHSDSDGATALKFVLDSPSSSLSEVETRMASKLVSLMNEFVRGVHFSRQLQQKADEAPSARSMLAVDRCNRVFGSKKRRNHPFGAKRAKRSIGGRNIFGAG
ncbi:uncharacterized protein LOC113301946 [Papaver somniferum]|nr:uncharacterized protein LOC113301946 [Papaver somniferum]